MGIRFAALKDKDFVKSLDRENMVPIIKETEGEYRGYMLDSFDPDKCLIIESGKESIGFAYLRNLGNKLEIQSIQIKKDFQGKGYGQELMSYIVNFAKSKRLKKVVLEAHDINRKAISFYERFGFKNLGEVKNKNNKIGFEFNIK